MNESVPMPDAAEAAPTRFEQTLACLMDIHRALADRAAGAPERRALEGLDAVLALVVPAGSKPCHIDMAGFTSFRTSLETAAESSPEAQALRLFADALEQMRRMADTFLPESDVAAAGQAEAEPAVAAEAGEFSEAPIAPVSEAAVFETVVVDAEPAEAPAADEVGKDLPEADAEAAAEADADPDVENAPEADTEPGDSGEDDEDGIDLEDGDGDVLVDDEDAVETVEEAEPPEAEPVAASAPPSTADAAETIKEPVASQAEPGEAVTAPIEDIAPAAMHETIDPETGETQRRIAELEGELANARALLAA